jgi:hypothetical protein
VLARALAVAVTTLAVGAGPASASTGFVIQQRQGATQSRLTLGSTGLRFDSLTPPRTGKKAQPQVGFIVRYSDRRLFLLDPTTKHYDAVSLSAAMTSYEAELKMVQQGQPSERLPPRPGTTPTRTGQAQLTLPKATLRRLKLTTRIGGLKARAYLLTQGILRQRLWYSTAIPLPPKNVRTALAKALGNASGSFGHALHGQAGRIALRIDEPKGKGWKTIVRTVKLQRKLIPASAFAAPKGYTEKNLLAQPRDVPATPIRCGLAINCLSAATIGPVSEHPDIWAIYWGTQFDSHKSFVGAVNHGIENMVGDEFADGNSPGFYGGLAQYGVKQGKFQGYEIVNENPDGSVGNWNFFDVDWLVLTHRFGSDAPNEWWRFGGDDPIFAIFVDSDEVDSSSWGGYHFFTPTEASVLAFLVHPAMPWLIVKVPSVKAIPDNPGDPRFKAALDKTTELASHEFVEAATDPYPFFSWADPLKEPIWSNGEISDICELGNTSPWSKSARTVKTGTAFSTYWDNDRGACVPDSQPILAVASPSDGETHELGSQVSFLASADDVFDGSVPDNHIVWTDNGTQIGTGAFAGTLPVGVHHIIASVTNSVGGTRSVARTVTVVAHPAAMAITHPADGTSFGSDETVTYRGTAFDPREGDVAAKATWAVDGTTVGTGAALFQHQIAAQGAHTVSLSYTDSVGLTGTASITVHVGPPTGKPAVTITDPPDGSYPPTDQQNNDLPFTFKGAATPTGQATIADADYVWTDSIDGPLGTGPTITKTLSGEGPCGGGIIDHHITLTVTDSSSRSASDAITVHTGCVG